MRIGVFICPGGIVLAAAGKLPMEDRGSGRAFGRWASAIRLCVCRDALAGLLTSAVEAYTFFPALVSPAGVAREEQGGGSLCQSSLRQPSRLDPCQRLESAERFKHRGRCGVDLDRT
jgi:hypothetical protein